MILQSRMNEEVIPTDEVVKKIYWSQREIAEMLNVSYATMTHWQEKFNVKTYTFRVGRARYSMYMAKEVALFHEIKRLLKEDLYTTEGAIRQLKLSKLI